MELTAADVRLIKLYGIEPPGADNTTTTPITLESIDRAITELKTEWGWE